jgi:ankyrin repeat protein
MSNTTLNESLADDLEDKKLSNKSIKLIDSDEFDINKKYYDGNTLLHLAVKAGVTKMVKKILDKNDVRVNIQNDSGDTPLHIAFKDHISRSSIIEYLANVPSINVNIQNNEGNTPLHEAVMNGQINELRYLFDENINVNVDIRNNDNTTALELSNYDKDLIDLLKEYKNIHEIQTPSNQTYSSEKSNTQSSDPDAMKDGGKKIINKAKKHTRKLHKSKHRRTLKKNTNKI